MFVKDRGGSAENLSSVTVARSLASTAAVEAGRCLRYTLAMVSNISESWILNGEMIYHNNAAEGRVSTACNWLHGRVVCANRSNLRAE